jgi:hypothetical protein
MYKAVNSIFLVVFLFIVISNNVYSQNRSSISGVVYDYKSNRPLPDIFVELLNEFESTLGRIKTESSGRFIFRNLARGSYKIKVVTFGTEYVEQIQEVQLVTFVRPDGETPDNIYLDFYLRYNDRNNRTATRSEGVIFAQEIPDEARKLYQKGVELIADKKEGGLEIVEQAIKIFPEYYDALDLLGGELVKLQRYKKSLPYLIKAIDVNQRSFSSFYALGYACYKLDLKTEAVEAFRASTILAPQSINAHLFYGVNLRLDKQYKKAEKELLQAKALAKKNPVAEIHWELGLLYNKLNRNIEAADELEMFLKVNPTSPDVAKIRELIIKLRNAK